MSDETKKEVPMILVEADHDHDTGEVDVTTHGPTCPRTVATYEAMMRGEDPGTTLSRMRSGPAQFASEAYRAGYDAIDWSGRRKVVGQA